MYEAPGARCQTELFRPIIFGSVAGPWPEITVREHVGAA
jgi:hypothetical protein